MKKKLKQVLEMVDWLTLQKVERPKIAAKIHIPLHHKREKIKLIGGKKMLNRKQQMKSW